MAGMDQICICQLIIYENEDLRVWMLICTALLDLLEYVIVMAMM